jgi:asparagine synthase (glutamine-hydrolysing)
MSAIAGIVDFGGQCDILNQGTRMMKALEQFPSDRVGTWNEGRAFLGCHAQWITPESLLEELPYVNPECSLIITADAIIDNRDELFDRLHVERSLRGRITDSELILLGYQAWGEDVPKWLIGDFAFMIWDTKEQRLFGARDFSGSRTLYYSLQQDCFTFCTIMAPLLDLTKNRQVNEAWLADYLALSIMVDSVDVFSTVYRDIKQVPPSHSITVRQGKAMLVRYCESPSLEKPLLLKSNEEYEEAFRAVVHTAVSARMRTHHNIGAHLSGGLDSSLVASFAARALREENRILHTFSYVPVDDYIDWTSSSSIANEKPYIQSTVKHVGNIQDHYFSFPDKNPWSDIDEFLDVMEMPYKFYANSYWLKGIFEQAQQMGIGVLLNGQRGNWTVSWGPALDFQANLLKRLQWVRFAREFRMYSDNTGMSRKRMLQKIKRKLVPSDGKADLAQMLIDPGFANRTGVMERLRMHDADDARYSLMTRYEARNHQFEQLFFWNITGTYGSKLSLRHALWDRDPTNDLRVVKFCFSVPEEQYVQNGFGRALLRRASKDYLPDQIRLNQRTRGIQGADGIQRMAPSWGAFLQELQEMCGDSLVEGLLNVKLIQSAVEKMRSGPRLEFLYDIDFMHLMRGLIVYRFLKKTS